MIINKNKTIAANKKGEKYDKAFYTLFFLLIVSINLVSAWCVYNLIIRNY